MPTDRVLDPDPRDDGLLRARRAPPPRTLIDIFHETLSEHPAAAAVDNGVEQLTYEELAEAAEELAAELNALGIGRGDRVGVRIRSGTTTLYVAISGILAAGAAYVPVDADDPDERARLIFTESAVAAVVGNDLTVASRRAAEPRLPEPPGAGDDAWIIFTSGSTGTPKGVAVTHRSAAAFVDAESRMFLQAEPLGAHDRVMAGLSVAFDASCEEMWLAWAHGACLVPAPRSLVRTGVDVGPWLVANDVTVVSSVPTLVALWPDESLAAVRLLILGGEACPPEIGARLVHPGREVWNTYGPTEATVVACGARLTVSDRCASGCRWTAGISLWSTTPGDTWPSARWASSSSAESGWRAIWIPTRTPRSTRRCRRSGGTGPTAAATSCATRQRDSSSSAEPTTRSSWAVDGSSWARSTTPCSGSPASGEPRLRFGVRRPGTRCSSATSRSMTASCRRGPRTVARGLPAALVPRLAVVDAAHADLWQGRPRRTPWPLPGTSDDGDTAVALEGNEAWIASAVAGRPRRRVTTRDDDFFDLGGGSLTAAQLVSRLRHATPRSPSRTSTRARPWPPSPRPSTQMALPASGPGRVRPTPLEDADRPGRRSSSLAHDLRPAVADLARRGQQPGRRRGGLDFLPRLPW